MPTQISSGKDKHRKKKPTEPSVEPQRYPGARLIERWPIDKLIPFARNPRTHSEAQIAQIAASIAEFGFNNPILEAPAPTGILSNVPSLSCYCPAM